MFHRALTGDGAIPFEHLIGRLSQEFGGARPTVILAERRRLPVGFMEQILEYRRYAEAKAANDANLGGWETDAMRTLAMQIELELVAEARARG